MRTAVGRAAASGEFLTIKPVSWLDRQRLAPRSAALSLSLSGRLETWNLELRSPERLLEILGLAETDLGLLQELGGRADGWQPFKFDASAPAEAGRLAGLGLVRLARWRRRLRLTGAGRALLLLTAIDPKIQKSGRAGR